MVSCRNSHSKNKPSSFWPILTISDYREIKTENCKNQTAVELLPIWCQVAHFKIAALREGRNRAISEQNTAQAGTFGMNTCTTDAGRPLKMVKDFKKAPSRVFIIAMLPPEVYVWQFCWFQIRAFSDFWPSPTRCLFALPSFCLLRWPVDCRVDGGNHPRHRLVVAEHPPTDLTSKSTVPHDVPRVFNHQNLVFMEFVSKMPSVEIHGNPCGLKQFGATSRETAMGPPPKSTNGTSGPSGIAPATKHQSIINVFDFSFQFVFGRDHLDFKNNKLVS